MSGNTSGALGFVQGLQGGMDFMDQRRRNKAIDKSISLRSHLDELEVGARKKDFMAEGGAEEGWIDFDDPTAEDPLMVRGFNYLKNKFGWGSKPDDTEATAGMTENVRETQDEAAVKPGFSAVGLADGGKVEDEERKKRSYGDYYVTEEEAEETRRYRSALPPRYQSPTSPYMARRRDSLTAGKKAIPTSGGGVREFIKDLGRSAAGYFDDTYAEATDTEAFDAATERAAGATNARERGAAARQQLAGAGGQMARTVGGLAKDAFVDNPLTQGLLGFVGFEGTRDNRQADPNTPPKVMSGKGDTPKAQAIAAAVGDEEPTANVAKKAVDAAIEMTPGHPDNPDQAFDWSEVAASGVTPEDIPAAPVADWANYRKQRAQAAAMRGEDPAAVQDSITSMQMNGFTANATQAAFLLKQGDARGAALAMRMAYQYFPNGSDVRFGIAEGSNGPVLVGMGVDEETGESVGKGEPMLLTPDTIAMFTEQAQNPDAWRAWTKDWHEMAMEDRKYNEITKPKEEQAMRTDRAREEALYAGAEKDRAYVRSGGGGSGGPKQSDFRASLSEMSERLFGSVEQEDLIAMEAIAERIRQVVPDAYQLGDAQIVDLVLKAYETDDFSEIQELLQRQ